MSTASPSRHPAFLLCVPSGSCRWEIGPSQIGWFHLYLILVIPDPPAAFAGMPIRYHVHPDHFDVPTAAHADRTGWKGAGSNATTHNVTSSCQDVRSTMSQLVIRVTSSTSEGRHHSLFSFARARRGVEGCSANTRPSSGIMALNGPLILSRKRS